MKSKITPQKDSEIEIAVEIPAKDLEKYREKAIKKLGVSIEISGFRKGFIPEKILAKHIGEDSILSEMARLSIENSYLHIIEEEKINAIGQPQITITKIAKDNPLEFKIRVAVMPEVTLPDYKKIGKSVFKEKIEIEITDKEVLKTIDELRARFNASKKTADSKGGDKLPELNDDFAKSVGDFKSVDDLKKKIKEGLFVEKERTQKDKMRIEFLDTVIKDSKIDLPKVLIEGEIDRMLFQLEGNITRAGETMDGYLTQTGKTKEGVRKELEPDAIKRVNAQLVLNKIISEEKVIVPENELVVELEKMKKVYKDARVEDLRAHIETIMANERVFNLFESDQTKNKNA